MSDTTERMIKVNVLVKLAVSEKDEPSPGALPLTAANVVSRVQDVLSDVTKHDGVRGQQLARQRIHRDKLRHDLDVAESMAAQLLDQYHTALGKVQEIRHDLDTHDSLTAISNMRASR